MILSVLTATILATPNFPAVVAAWSSGPSPDCTVCHRGAPMRGTVTTPFGAALRERGLMASDEATLTTALENLQGVDSDGDGANDRDELRDGGDPNQASTTAGPPLPQYGCSTAPGQALWSLLILSLTLPRRARGHR